MPSTFYVMHSVVDRTGPYVAWNEFAHANKMTGRCSRSVLTWCASAKLWECVSECVDDFLLRLACGVCGTECSSVGRAIDCSVGCCVSVCSEINWSLVRFRPLGNKFGEFDDLPSRNFTISWIVIAMSCVESCKALRINFCTHWHSVASFPTAKTKKCICLYNSFQTKGRLFVSKWKWQSIKSSEQCCHFLKIAGRTSRCPERRDARTKVVWAVRIAI